jgi:hypothetical protein
MKSTTYRGEAPSLSVYGHLCITWGDGFQDRFLGHFGIVLVGSDWQCWTSALCRLVACVLIALRAFLGSHVSRYALPVGWWHASPLWSFANVVRFTVSEWHHLNLSVSGSQ